MRRSRADEGGSLGVLSGSCSVGELQVINAGLVREKLRFAPAGLLPQNPCDLPPSAQRRAIPSRSPRSISASACWRTAASSGRSFRSRASWARSSTSRSAALARRAGISASGAVLHGPEEQAQWPRPGLLHGMRTEIGRPSPNMRLSR
jgi:hypothetical protein